MKSPLIELRTRALTCLLECVPAAKVRMVLELAAHHRNGGATHTLDLTKIHAVAAATDSPNLLRFGLVFLVVGIAFKFGAAPFHMWLPDVYQGSPTAVTVFIGSAPKLAALATKSTGTTSPSRPFSDRAR